MTWYNFMYEIKYVRLHRSHRENNIQVTDDAYKQVRQYQRGWGHCIIFYTSPNFFYNNVFLSVGFTTLGTLMYFDQLVQYSNISTTSSNLQFCDLSLGLYINLIDHCSLSPDFWFNTDLKGVVEETCVVNVKGRAIQNKNKQKEL